MAIKTVQINKTYKAESILYGEVVLNRTAEGDLAYRRSYTFVDINGNPVPMPLNNDLEVKNTFELRGVMSWADVPENIKEALAIIDTYTKNEIKEKEGIK